jgi:hypothetical protein
LATVFQGSLAVESNFGSKAVPQEIHDRLSFRRIEPSQPAFSLRYAFGADTCRALHVYQPEVQETPNCPKVFHEEEGFTAR